MFLTACGDDPPTEVHVSAAEGPRLTGLVFHGDCIAGWAMEATLRVSAGAHGAVTLQELGFRFTEGTTSEGETLDAATIEERYGQGATTIAAGGSRDYRVGIRWPRGTATRVSLSGPIAGTSASGTLRTTYALPDLAVTITPMDPGLGACLGV
jgi:hypothetical protein